MCLDTGRVIEFHDEIIEERQRMIAKEHGLVLTNHSLYLYGKPIDSNSNN